MKALLFINFVAFTDTMNILHKKIIFPLLVIALFFSKNSDLRAQSLEHFFVDDEPKEYTLAYDCITYNNSIILAGSSLDRGLPSPAIMRIDTVGDTLWHSITKDTNEYADSYKRYFHKIMLGSDNFLYALYFVENSSQNEIWKLNPNTGSIVWKKSFNYVATGYKAGFIIDYDASKFIVTYQSKIIGNKYSSLVRFAFVSKTTGDTISSHNLGEIISINPKYGLCLDNQKNIYYTNADTIYKLNRLNVNSLFWKKSFSSAGVDNLQNVYYDFSTQGLFAFGTANSITKQGIILKISSGTGNLVSTVTAQTSDAVYKNMKVANGHAFVIWGHLTNNAGPPRAYWTTKYNLSTGVAAWHSSFGFHYGNNQAPLSVDVDYSGDVYLTGYYRSYSSFGPGLWGMIKLKGSTGDTIYKKTITNNPLNAEDSSIGKWVFLINNSPYLLGQLQTANILNYSKSVTATLVRLNPSNGNELIKKPIYGGFQYVSNCFKILNYPNKQTLLVKQKGRFVSLEMYDSAKNKIWEKVFKKKGLFTATCVTISPENGDIYLGGATLPNVQEGHFGSGYDSSFVIQLSGTGTVKNEYKYQENEGGAINELYNYGKTTYALSYSYSFIFIRKIDSLGFSYAKTIGKSSPLGFLYVDQKYYVDIDTQRSLLIDNGEIYELNKKTFSLSNAISLSIKLKRISYTTAVNSSVLICGRSGDSGIGTIGLYDYHISSTKWIFSMPEGMGSGITKFALGENNSYVYTMAYHEVYNTAGAIIIRKHRVSTGELLWTYTFPVSDPITEWQHPVDICFDSIRNQILVTGFYTTNTVGKAFIIVLDSTGNRLNKKFYDGRQRNSYTSNYNSGHCIGILHDGTRWLGGRLDKMPYWRAGFVFEVGVCSTTNTAINKTACYQYVSPSGKILTYSGIYKDTVPSQLGCDSIFTINLTINNDTSSLIAKHACKSYLSPSGKYTWTNSGSYVDTVHSSYGCDSIINISLTIHQDTSATISPVSCGSYLSPSGKYTWSINGSYFDTLPSSYGCDSIITVNLSIGSYSTSNVSITNCKSFTSPSGKYVWLSSGTYLDTIPTLSACDSIITISLTINKVDSGVTVNNNTLIANETGAVYQWVDCNTDSMVQGAISRSFTPIVNGTYAVIVSKNNCTDTSSCYVVNNVGVNEPKPLGQTVFVYPNPTFNTFTIDYPRFSGVTSVKIYTAAGQKVIEALITSRETVLDMTDFSSAVYIIELNTEGILHRVKLIKQ